MRAACIVNCMSLPRRKRFSKLASWACCAISLVFAGNAAADVVLTTAEIFVMDADDQHLPLTMPPATVPGRTIDLPFLRDMRDLAPEERVKPMRTWIRMTFSDDRPNRDESLMFYVPRWSGGDTQLLLNGQPLV